jgi:hypothetical protein
MSQIKGFLVIFVAAYSCVTQMWHQWYQTDAKLSHSTYTDTKL